MQVAFFCAVHAFLAVFHGFVQFIGQPFEPLQFLFHIQTDAGQLFMAEVVAQDSPDSVLIGRASPIRAIVSIPYFAGYLLMNQLIHHRFGFVGGRRWSELSFHGCGAFLLFIRSVACPQPGFSWLESQRSGVFLSYGICAVSVHDGHVGPGQLPVSAFTSDMDRKTI